MFYFNIGNGVLMVLLEVFYDMVCICFNDGCCDVFGCFWCGIIYELCDCDGGILYCFECNVLCDVYYVVVIFNGVVFSLDQCLMYYVNMLVYCINVYDYDLVIGQISNCCLLCQFDSDKIVLDYGGCLDGVVVDSEGVYWCVMFEGGWVLWLLLQGEILQEICVLVCCLMMVVFGGEDLCMFFIMIGCNGCSEVEFV